MQRETDQRYREFLEKLRANLAHDDPSDHKGLVDEFRALFLDKVRVRTDP